MLNIVAISGVRDTFRLGYLVTVVGYFVFSLECNVNDHPSVSSIGVLESTAHSVELTAWTMFRVRIGN